MGSSKHTSGGGSPKRGTARNKKKAKTQGGKELGVLLMGFVSTDAFVNEVVLVVGQKGKGGGLGGRAKDPLTGFPRAK